MNAREEQTGQCEVVGMFNAINASQCTTPQPYLVFLLQFAEESGRGVAESQFCPEEEIFAGEQVLWGG